MSDIALPRTLPASAVPGTTAGSTAATASAAVSNLPTALANLAVTNLIEGVVIERTGKNTVLVRTDDGTLPLHTALALKPGRRGVVGGRRCIVGGRRGVCDGAMDGKDIGRRHRRGCR